MAREESVFKRKEGKIIISLFFIVVVFLILLSAWDKRNQSSGEPDLSSDTSESVISSDPTFAENGDLTFESKPTFQDKIEARVLQ